MSPLARGREGRTPSPPIPPPLLCSLYHKSGLTSSTETRNQRHGKRKWHKQGSLPSSLPSSPQQRSKSSRLLAPSPLYASSHRSNFKYPEFYAFPPFYSKQPNSDTESKRKQLWRDLILSYCRQTSPPLWISSQPTPMPPRAPRTRHSHNYFSLSLLSLLPPSLSSRRQGAGAAAAAAAAAPH
jgi:hypothetical protein